MAATIHPIHGGPAGETLLGFIARQGCVTTWEVANRFGWDMREALQTLNHFRRIGKLTSTRTTVEWGAMNEWRCT